jgi:hypothetical protein
VKGVGDQIDYGARVYDPRGGRFYSIDPLTQKYPELTPYQFASNTPIQGSDLDGMEVNFSNAKMQKQEYIPGVPKILQWETFRDNVAASTYNSIVQDAQDVVNVAVSSKGRHEVLTKYGTTVLKMVQFSNKPIDQQYASLKRHFSNISNVEDLIGGIGAGAIESFGVSLLTRGTSALAGKILKAPYSPQFVEATGTGFYRGDTRSPNEIFNSGFDAKGSSKDIVDYVESNAESVYIGTSKDVSEAVKKVNTKGYVYVVSNNGQGLDVNNYYKAFEGRENPHATEQEVIFGDKIPSSQIQGAYPVVNGKIDTKKFIKNPAYKAPQTTDK